MNRQRMILNEEITKSDVESIVRDKLSSYLKRREAETLIKDIVADCVERFFKMMYNKRGFWKNDIKNG